jgi:hypothetical protein
VLSLEEAEVELQMVEVEVLSLSLGQMHLEEIAERLLQLPYTADSTVRMQHNLHKLHTDRPLHSTVRIGQCSQPLALDYLHLALLELLGS